MFEDDENLAHYDKQGFAESSFSRVRRTRLQIASLEEPGISEARTPPWSKKNKALLSSKFAQHVLVGFDADMTLGTEASSLSNSDRKDNL